MSTYPATAMSAPVIPLNDLTRHAAHVAPTLRATAKAVLVSGSYILGTNVQSFENAFARYCGTAHCIGVGNGTDAIELALRASGVEPGDGVVVCANAAMYGTGAVLAMGAKPVFADVDINGLLTADNLTRAIASAQEPPRAVIVTHLYGRLADMATIVPAARAHDLRVIEDCAQAHGARAGDGCKAGAWGDAAAFSFYPTKNLGAIGDGGAVLCDDDAIALRLRQLRQYGWSEKYNNAIAGGRNSRLDELQAAFLLAMLPDLDERNKRRRAIARRYSRDIVHPHIRVPDAEAEGYVAHLYVVLSEQRDALAAHLAMSGIASEVHYPTPDYRQPMHDDRFASVCLPTTERLCKQVLTLPCFPDMFDAEVDAVIAACNAWSG